MPVGTFDWPDVQPVSGIRMSAVEARVRYQGRKDLALIEICEGASVAGVFTRNAFCAEPVKLCRAALAEATPRYLLVNSGNANACTGDAGYAAALACCEAVAKAAGVEKNQVLPFSTGVIGELLPSETIVAAVPELVSGLNTGSWLDVAHAIMTTDTRPKGLTKHVKVGGQRITVSGVAKGAGMINPNMGTMLAYVATDANIEQSVLESMTKAAANSSFNRITIDGDTSTNDALMVMASGRVGASISDIESADAQLLEGTITDVCQRLAIEMVRDAEGATKCVTVDVTGGKTAQECLDVAYAICHSPLVKTACFASDPNWGRIVCAIGYSGVPDLDAKKVRVWLNEQAVVENGGRAESYTEALGQQVFDQAEFSIRVELGRGDKSETLWTSDLSHDYVKINAEYRS